MKNILLSVIIPTKDRYSTLIPVLKSLLKYIESDEIEFIIQDNSENKEDLGDLLLDKRVVYNYIATPMSIKDNTIHAINVIRGEYTIFIGDDDLISPYIVEIVSYFKAKDTKCIIYPAGYYWWESVNFIKKTYYHRNCAYWIPNSDCSINELNAKKELDFAIHNGGAGMFNLPRFYHGIIKTELLYKIKEKTGSFLNGSSPDMGFAASLAMIVETYAFINYPVSIYGASKNSGGGLSASNKHYGKIEDQKHLPSNILDIWDRFIPLIWSEKAIYAESMSEVLRCFNSDKKLNYLSLYATMYVYEPYLHQYINKCLFKLFKSNPFTIILFMFYFVKKKIGLILRRGKYIFKKFGFKTVVLDNVDLVMNYSKDNLKVKL